MWCLRRVRVALLFGTTEPGIYVYLCTPHVRHGMISFIIVGDDISNKDQIAETLLFGKSQTKLDEFVESL